MRRRIVLRRRWERNEYVIKWYILLKKGGGPCAVWYYIWSLYEPTQVTMSHKTSHKHTHTEAQTTNEYK